MLLALAFIVAFLSAVDALYMSPNPWTSTLSSVSANITQAAMLLPRQDGGGTTTIYANGKFLDDYYASLFSCAPTPTSSEAPPPPPASSSPPPLLPPSAPSLPPGSLLTCYDENTPTEGDKKGSKHVEFNKATMREFVDKGCSGKYKRDGKEFYEDRLQPSAIEGRNNLQRVQANPYRDKAKINREECSDYFQGIFDNCKRFLQSRGAFSTAD
ncbi:MAG: hypothetical protein L6R39_000579 [Caloplaca ligustica]|nr:MAG: hypothetical protein L6R39_000579 [Caloplaca ligustica]